MIIDITLTQRYLFRELSNKLAEQNKSFRIASTIRPDKNIFNVSNFETYVKYIQSVYRFDYEGKIYYIVFRNCLNRNDNSFTIPSSIEFINVDTNKTFVSLFKYHYFNGKSDNILSTYDYEYNDMTEMKKDIKVIGDFLINKIISLL